MRLCADAQDKSKYTEQLALASYMQTIFLIPFIYLFNIKPQRFSLVLLFASPRLQFRVAALNSSAIVFSTVCLFAIVDITVARNFCVCLIPFSCCCLFYYFLVKIFLLSFSCKFCQGRMALSFSFLCFHFSYWCFFCPCSYQEQSAAIN